VDACVSNDSKGLEEEFELEDMLLDEVVLSLDKGDYVEA
jgi:hypothetical protein